MVPAIMAVPAHDTRDYEFATEFGLPITEVVSGGDISKDAFTESGKAVNSANESIDLNGKSKQEATSVIGRPNSVANS